MTESAREAEWLTREEAERAVARREGWTLSPEFFRRAKAPTAIALAFGGVFALALLGALVQGSVGDGGVFLALAGLSLGLIPLVRRWEKAQEAAGEADRELRESFGRGGRFVSLIVRQGDAPTGEDRGMLWFEDGRLYFSGHRTSFGLVPSQTQGFVRIEERVSGVRNELNLLLARGGLNGPTVLSLGPYVTRHGNADYAAGTLKADIDRWRERTTGREGPGQWPPATVGPCVASERRLLRRAIAWTFGLPLVPVGLLSLFGVAPLGKEIAYALSALSVACSPTGALIWRAWWGRRRLRRAR